MKPPLLLLHGALGAAYQFEKFRGELENVFDVYQFDFTGHGKEPAYEGKFSIELFRENVLSFITKKKIESVNIFGYSMGGFVALYLALQHPEKVAKIATLATKFDWTPQVAASEIKFLDSQKIKEKVPAFAKHLHQLHGEKWEMLMKQTADLLLQLGDNNPLTFQELAKIKIKVLIALGDRDKMVTLEETQAAQKSISNSTFHLFRDTPHPWEQVDQKLIAREFLRFFTPGNSAEGPDFKTN